VADDVDELALDAIHEELEELDPATFEVSRRYLVVFERLLTRASCRSKLVAFYTVLGSPPR
jgi:hypothetical protein